MFPKARVALTFLAVFVALLGVVTVAYAGMYIIDTNDASVAEWATQSIPVFLSDPVDGGVAANMDMLDTYVARSLSNTNFPSDTLNFRMQFNSSDPLVTAATAALAILNCDNDLELSDDPDDRIIAYVRTGNLALADDAVYVAYGDFSAYWFAGADNPSVLNPPFGQVVDSDVEWAVALLELDTVDPSYCQDPAGGGIRFATANISVNIFTGDVTVTHVDQNPAFRGYDVPTAVKLESLEASSRPANAAAFSILLGMLATIGVGAVVVTRSRRRL
ncbi:MAG: hypothetical protein HY870_24400 [Chloroflexi bacterium]|nr:hypothetical protein [Chloroflexota bacterium]